MKKAVKLVLFLFTFSLFQSWSFFHPPFLDSATLTNAKNLVSNSRLSFSTALEGNHNVGDTTITIDTSNYPDKNTNHLFPGDTVTIGSHDYIVATIITSSKFSITSGLQSGDTADDTPVYVKQTANHIISFTTASAVANGAIRISVPATANNTNDSDGRPDADGFDLNSVSSSDITCPSDDENYDFVTPTATDAGGSGWHTFECRYSGNGSSSKSMSITIGGTNKLLNPAPESGHTQGTADDYTIRIQNLDSNYSVVDEVDVKVIVVEAVRVTATIEETLAFTISGRSSGNTHCGYPADITTTVYSVPFGSIITANSFKNGAQQLTVSTNADDGYKVTVFEDDELGLNGADSPYIPDTSCNTSCTHTTSDEWTNSSSNGFGYSLQNVSGSDAKFQYSGGTWLAKQFPNRSEGSTQDQDTNAEIMSNSGPVSGSSVYVCYRISVSGIQEAGNYYNNITYVATPQF